MCFSQKGGLPILYVHFTEWTVLGSLSGSSHNETENFGASNREKNEFSKNDVEELSKDILRDKYQAGLTRELTR